MRGLIERYVREMVKIPSTSNTEMEKNCADYIAEELAKQPYFKEHPEQTGKYLLPEDSLGRSVPWGLVKGNGGFRKTIILTGHYDVVDTEEYGNERALAYDVEKWENLGKSGNVLPGMPDEVKEDFLSGDWMFGRGTADMKGGLSVGLVLLDWYGKIVAEADRIIDPEVTLRRTVQYGLSHYPEMDKEQQYERFRKHLADKYAEGGYLKLWIPQSDNAGRLAELRHLIANEEKLREVFNKLYLQEKD